MQRSTVLILSRDPAFSREITAHWPRDPAGQGDGPEFVVLDQAFRGGLESSHYDLAIVDAVLPVKKEAGRKKTNSSRNLPSTMPRTRNLSAGMCSTHLWPPARQPW